MLSKEEIKEVIPYQEPFLFVDEVEEMDKKSISGTWQTSKEDFYYNAHFVDFNIVPGVLVVEALAQLSTIFLRKQMGKSHKNYHFLAYKVRGTQFFSPIYPEEKVSLKSEILAVYDTPKATATKLARVFGKAFVGEELKVESRFSIAVVKKSEIK